jgi:pilus assembly protein Flp/PilA
MNAIWRFLKDDSGPTAVEYAVMVGLIILTAMSAIATLGSTTNHMWQDLIADGLSKI